MTTEDIRRSGEVPSLSQVVAEAFEVVKQIPWDDFGGSGTSLHFAHANGYPPGAYRILLQQLAAHYHVFAMQFRPLWPGAIPAEVHDWEPFATDLQTFLQAKAARPLIGIGHSMGGTSTLRVALRRPELFQALVLIDPVLLPPYMSPIWDLIYRLRLGMRLYPLAKGAQRRRRVFASQEEMLDNYRQKAVFARVDDANLRAYVEALALPQADGQVSLAYPTEWEVQVYLTGVRRDLEIWRGLPALKIPLLVLRGALSDTLWPATARRIQRALPQAQVITIPDCGHLLPLERPATVTQAIEQFLSNIHIS